MSKKILCGAGKISHPLTDFPDPGYKEEKTEDGKQKTETLPSDV